MQETLDFIYSKINNFTPEIAIILGSGLGHFCDSLDGISIKYSDIPNFPKSTVEGHKGEMLFCEIEEKKCVIMQGRFHYYEGYSMQESTYPIKIFKKLGVKNLILTNASGALHKEIDVGDIVLMTDHINFMGTNPLIGKNDDSLGVRFPSMSECYSKKLRNIALLSASELNLKLKEGVYIAVSGPSYETPSEVKAYKMLGADVVGMSSAPEAIVANYLGIKVLGLSLATNYAAGVTENIPNHAEVLEIGKLSAEKLTKLVKNIISKLD